MTENKNEEVKEETVENKEEVKEEKKDKPWHKSNKEEMKELKTQIDQLEGEVANLKNEYAKAYADTENTRKRLQSEFEVSKKYRIQDFALDMLPVIDNCERALSQEINEHNEGYHKGVQMIYQQLLSALQKEGVEVMDIKVGDDFDANYHQAIMSEKVDGMEEGKIVEVLQKGYKLKDRILRAAMVKVSA